nr:transposase [Paenibacillus sp. HGH0039]
MVQKKENGRRTEINLRESRKVVRGKIYFSYGIKGHLEVGTRSQYILGDLLSSGNLHNGKAAIPLLKGITLQHPNYTFNYATMDSKNEVDEIGVICCSLR